MVASMDPLLGCLDEEVSVYYAKDDYVAGAELVAVDRGAIESWTRRLCSAADVVVEDGHAIMGPGGHPVEEREPEGHDETSP